MHPILPYATEISAIRPARAPIGNAGPYGGHAAAPPGGRGFPRPPGAAAGRSAAVRGGRRGGPRRAAARAAEVRSRAAP
ncbi:hypothetical protein D5H75_29915 [Bailinhaonella thermotolerans]|uniref:Uncharacterized protein n=1 Tax=Bailinhaonella thermotolerans TaxID=1070861 RepID=A0A3A4A8X0_9ACTN|nr:hypothetical protein D5H75_29915 [Bailinhaonella thermotolerans]